jgi:CheY-like chemotaxis protein
VSARVLVVEDDADLRECLADVLRTELGLEVAEAANGKEALGALGAPPTPCLILLDIMMPVMNGLEFLAAVAGGPPEIDRPPVLILSANTSALPAVHYPSLVGVLRKPILTEELLAAVERCCKASPTT